MCSVVTLGLVLKLGCLASSVLGQFVFWDKSFESIFVVVIFVLVLLRLEFISEPHVVF